MNRRDASGNWVECEPVLQSFPAGILATGATYRVILHRNLNRAGSVDFETSDGHRIVSHPLALAYYDPVDGRRAWIAQIKDCDGEVSSNQVIYADAFAGKGIAGAVVYTYDVGRFHQDVIFTQQPGVTPADFGMSAQARLEIVTELIQSPVPQKQIRTLHRTKGVAARAAMVEPDLIDETLTFGGEMKMTRGYAFPNFTGNRRDRLRLPVAKQLRTLGEGRTMLTESLLWSAVESELRRLPGRTAGISKVEAAALLAGIPSRPKAGGDLSRPFATQLARVAASGQRQLVALSQVAPQGFTVDYTMLQSSAQTDFPSGTYLIPNGTVELDGPCEFGECVFKFEEGGALYVNEWEPNGAANLIFTAKDDDSVGAVIAGSTGQPSGYYGYFASEGLPPTPYMGSLDFRYMYAAMQVSEEGEATLQLSGNVYLRHCDEGFSFGGGDNFTLLVDHPFVCDVQTYLFIGENGSYYSPYDPPDTADCDGDYDNDGMDDGWEVRYFGNIGAGPNEDFDNDGRTNLQEYVAGTDPTDADHDQDGLPDGWEWYWFGNYSHSGSELDAAGRTLLYDYQYDLDPNGIVFAIVATNNYVSGSNPALAVHVTAGFPAFMAVLVDSTNRAAANWVPYTSSNFIANLGGTPGWKELRVGLKGVAPDADVAWHWKRLKLDTAPPLLTLTSPVGSVADVPLIQLSGYADEALDRISYDLDNALGLVTNQQVAVSTRHFDREAWEVTTSFFEAVDIPLTNGVNTITIHATDRAGNATSLVTNITLDYSNKTNPPVITLTWPTNQTQISGSSFNWRGFSSDPTARVLARITSDAGATETRLGMIERNGRFWVDDLPLNPGTNTLLLTVTDVVGNLATTNISVIQSSLVLTVDPVSDPAVLWQPTVDLSGTISDPSRAVWVNGIKGYNHGNGTWSASNVPTTPGGVASFTVTAYEETDQQPDGSYGN